THVYTAKHFCMSSAIRAFNGDGFHREQSDPCIDPCTADDGNKAKQHEDYHYNRMVSKIDPDVHNDNTDEDQRQGKSPNAIDFIFIRFHYLSPPCIHHTIS